MSDDPLMDAARVLMESALSVIDGDGHMFGTRPCESCRIITSLRGKPFGCVRVAGRGPYAGIPGQEHVTKVPLSPPVRKP